MTDWQETQKQNKTPTDQIFEVKHLLKEKISSNIKWSILVLYCEPVFVGFYNLQNPIKSKSINFN